MKNKLGIFGAIVLIVFGMGILKIAGSNFSEEGFNFGILILFLYGIIPLGLAFYTLFNLDKEDKIEQIKDTKKD